MKRHRQCWGVLTVIVIVAAVGLIAGSGNVPHLLNYQGRLTDGGGNPLNGRYAMTFSLYSQATGGGPLWAETQSNVTVASGLFNVLLGSGTSLPTSVFAANPEVYLGVSVGSDPEMTPRQRIVAVAYALVAETAETATTADNAANDDLSNNVIGDLGNVNAPSASGSDVLTWNGSNWVPQALPTGDGWSLTGNAGIDPASQFLGTTDNKSVVVKTDGSERMRILDDGSVRIGTGDPWFEGQLTVFANSDYYATAVSAQSSYTGPALRAINLAANGTAMYAFTEGTNSTGVLICVESGTIIEANVGDCGNTVFRVEGDGEVYADGGFHGGGADLAEMLPGGAGLEPGDVLILDADGTLVRSTAAYQTSVVGVHSTEPGFVGGSGVDDDLTGKIPLAISGIVPVKATAENGPIRPGDLLTSAHTPGHAMFADRFVGGAILGKALEGLEDGIGVIRMLVMLQ